MTTIDKKLVAITGVIRRSCPGMRPEQITALAAHLIRTNGAEVDAFGGVTFTEAARKLDPRLPEANDVALNRAAYDAQLASIGHGYDDRTKTDRAAVYEARINDATAHRPGSDANALRAERAALAGRTDHASKLRSAAIAEALINMGERVTGPAANAAPSGKPDLHGVINAEINERRNGYGRNGND